MKVNIPYRLPLNMSMFQEAFDVSTTLGGAADMYCFSQNHR